MSHHWTSSSAGPGSLLRLLGRMGIPWAWVRVGNSLKTQVAHMFADPRCDENTKRLVREFITGPQGEAG